jgi:hypothetical protein
LFEPWRVQHYAWLFAATIVYLSVGKYAGQAQSEWGGRIKIPLSEITWDQVAALSHGRRLSAKITGRSPKGGPALASVQLLSPGWMSTSA